MLHKSFLRANGNTSAGRTASHEKAINAPVSECVHTENAPSDLGWGMPGLLFSAGAERAFTSQSGETVAAKL
jgi:hypothetical protein